MKQDDQMITSENLQILFYYCDKIVRNKIKNNKNSKLGELECKLKYINGLLLQLYKENDNIFCELLNKECDRNYLLFVVDEWSKKGWRGSTDLDNSIKYLKSHDDDKYVNTFTYLFCQYELHNIRNDIEVEQTQPNIEKIYGTKDNSNLDRYGLIHIGGGIRLLVMSPPRVYDLHNDKTIILNINKSMAKLLNNLYENGLIRAMSFKGKDNAIYNGYMDKELVYANKEIGEIFSLNLDALPEVNKFYDTGNYSNQLWVRKEKHNMLTFEELLDDFMIKDDSIMTQLIHLEYTCNDSLQYYITHMDHEYIFYTPEEYEKRVNGTEDIRGDAKKKIKTFKIDKATIPFNYQCDGWKIKDNSVELENVPFIYYILDNYFQHKALLDEYFEKILF